MRVHPQGWDVIVVGAGHAGCEAALAPWTAAKVRAQAEVQAMYRGYIDRQRLEVARLRGLEAVPVPESFDYRTVTGLLTESRQKLDRVRPRTLGQASRIPGVTPEDVQILWVHVERRRRVEAATPAPLPGSAPKGAASSPSLRSWLAGAA